MNVKIFLAANVVVLCIGAVFARTAVPLASGAPFFTGAAGTDFASARNWSGGAVPTSADSFSVTGGTVEVKKGMKYSPASANRDIHPSVPIFLSGRNGKPSVFSLSSGSVKVVNGMTMFGMYGKGVFNQSGGSYYSPSYVAVGRYVGDEGWMNLTGGTFTVAHGKAILVGEEGAGHLVVGGDALCISPITYFGKLASSANSTILLQKGGVLQSGSFLSASTSSTLTFDGGTLRTCLENTDYPAYIPANIGVKVRDGGALFEVGSGSTATVLASVADADGCKGSLTKTGFGTLRLAGKNTYTGATVVKGGMLTMSAQAAARTASIDVHGGCGFGAYMNEYVAWKATVGPKTTWRKGSVFVADTASGPASVAGKDLPACDVICKTGAHALTITSAIQGVKEIRVYGGQLRAGSADAIPSSVKIELMGGSYEPHGQQSAVVVERISDEMEADWIAQDGPVPLNMTYDDWRAKMLSRRAERLKSVARMSRKWAYCRHFVMGGSHYAYTEALTDAQAERTYLGIGSSLCMAEYCEDGLWRETTLLETKEGCFRDVDVSPDGKRLLYSFKASDRGDDFHLYEMDLATRKTRQLTSGKGAADYEGCYLPDGRILFNSTRCMQIVDCFWTEVSNIYRCEADGSNITRITFDQVHDNYPALTWDGRVLYTRWEYNDRSQIFPQPLFGMNVDGTNQRAVYGGNSWFPTTIIHARSVPGSPMFFGVATGHHSLQPGELMRFDPREGREEAQGAWQLEPLRKATACRIDVYGQNGRMAAYPYPVDENGVVLSFLPQGWRRGGNGSPNYKDHRAPFALYWTDVYGARELLVSQKGKVPCGRPVPVCVRELPKRPSVRPDENAKTGIVAVRDVYEGESMKGVPRGTVKSMRVVSIVPRQAGIGYTYNFGAGGLGLSSTPPALGNGTWDVKRVLGEVPVAEDGSVTFSAPIGTPFYFMLLDGNGRMVQTMRSWTVLQPGETASCVGCHEPPNQAPKYQMPKSALGAKMASVRKSSRGFSFPKDVQPILDRRCVSCHDPGKNAAIPDLTSATIEDPVAKRRWSKAYLSLTRAKISANRPVEAAPNSPQGYANWIDSASEPTLLPPLKYGSRVSRLMSKLDQGHCREITDAEKRVIACWMDLGVPFCGDYTEGAAWNGDQSAFWTRYTVKKARLATAREKIED